MIRKSRNYQPFSFILEIILETEGLLPHSYQAGIRPYNLLCFMRFELFWWKQVGSWSSEFWCHVGLWVAEMFRSNCVFMVVLCSEDGGDVE